MNFIGKLSLTLTLLLVLAVTVLYLLLPTSWAAGVLCHWINSNSQYHLAVEKIDYSWSRPTQLRLMNIKLSAGSHSVHLDAQQVTLGLGWQQLTTPLHFHSLLLQNGTLTFDFNTPVPLPQLRADFLQLANMSLNTTSGQWRISGHQVNARVLPWPSPTTNFSENSQFKLSAGSLDIASLNINGIAIKQALIEGEFNKNHLLLSNFGAEIAGGTVTGDTLRIADGSWLCDNLRLSNTRLQSSGTLKQLWQQSAHSLSSLPPITFKRFDLVKARLQGVNWAFSDLDFTLQNITLQKGHWQAADGSLALNATDIIIGSTHFIDPIASMTFDASGIAIKQFSTRWEGGLLRASGRWIRKIQHLQLDDVALAALEYTLPADWKTVLRRPLPHWLSKISVAKLSADNNLLIDITPAFPFQVTSLDTYGNNLLLAQEHHWNLWSGLLTVNASNATFNKNDLRHFTMTLNADDQQITLSNVNAFASTGLLEASATIGQQERRPFSLQLTGRSVEINTLHNWGWPLLPLHGKGDLQLKLTGELSSEVPFKASLSGSVEATDSNKRQISQMMQQGEISAATDSH